MIFYTLNLFRIDFVLILFLFTVFSLFLANFSLSDTKDEGREKERESFCWQTYKKDDKWEEWRCDPKSRDVTQFLEWEAGPEVVIILILVIFLERFVRPLLEFTENQVRGGWIDFLVLENGKRKTDKRGRLRGAEKEEKRPTKTMMMMVMMIKIWGGGTTLWEWKLHIYTYRERILIAEDRSHESSLLLDKRELWKFNVIK